MKRLILIILFFVASLVFATDKIEIWGHQSHNLSEWEVRKFNGQTSYQSIDENGLYIIKATSQDSASGLYKNVDINLNEFPLLHWRWKIKSKLPHTNERSKQGDDFAARVYVIASTGIFFWNKKVICYVWSNSESKNTSWNNPYTGSRVKEYAIRSGQDKTNTWYAEVRNIKEDFNKLFGTEIDEINDIAIMTDTDNTHSSATAWYAGIYFD
ncbi:DUF3047 domain-containing protein [Francisellaceae bacterium]|nr:DUF3047 domain-containing protein [Francisellaceae bacterium]